MSKCKRSCCWTPHQVCARKNECPCHRADAGEQQQADWATAFDMDRASTLRRVRAN